MTEYSRVPLSALDVAPVFTGLSATQALRNTVALAQRLEQLNYVRFWVAEHHDLPSLATSATAVLVAAVAGATNTMRVGSGGIMLPNHPPLIVAEQFGTLEALHPGRIDLGIGRAPGSVNSAITQMLNRRGESDEDFRAQIDEMNSYFAAGPGQPAPNPHSGVAGENRPPMVILGSSLASARMAGSLGVPYAYAHHINPNSATEALDAYRASFQPSARFPDPYTLIAALVFADDTDEQARELAEPFLVGQVRMRSGHLDSLFPTPEQAAEFSYTDVQREWAEDRLGRQIWGSPETVRDKVTDLITTTGANELMAITMVYDHARRLRSYELLAETVGKVPASMVRSA